MRVLSHVVMALALASAPAWLAEISAAPFKSGRWLLRASGQPLLLLELHKDSHAKGGWAGAFIHPKHFSADLALTTFSSVEGPATAEPVIAAVAHSDELDLTTRDSSGGLTHLVWKPSGSAGTIEFKDVNSPPIHLVAARPNDRVADAWNAAIAYSATTARPDSPGQADNREMSAIFDADQADRKELGKIDWSVVAPRDEARRSQTKALLDAGKLHTANDFYHAAFVFQHGGKPADYLLAHTLAVIAAARGRTDATWIAAATLDRYLMNIGQKQIYGTQFVTPQNGPTTQEPYDRTLISDAIRAALGVPPLKAQEKQRKQFQMELKGGNPAKP